MVENDTNISFPSTKEKVFGRRKSKRLSFKQKENFQHYLAKYSIFESNGDGSFDLQQIDLNSLFDKVTDFELEIGFGMGDFLFQKALSQPNIGFLGCEVFENGVANLVTRIKEKDLKNIFLHPGNCIGLLDNLKGLQLKSIYILFPDPWPKQKHRKRRFLTAENIDRMILALKIGGCIYVATDIGEYAREISSNMNKRVDVKALSVLVEDFKAPLGNQFQTKFERKAYAQDRVPQYMVFKRIV
tara:strand:- start:636 stop:1364 length:729 start_codon:yes stop_codon:yes gene_type:complete